jgi:hypothetical protein
MGTPPIPPLLTPSRKIAMGKGGKGGLPPSQLEVSQGEILDFVGVFSAEERGIFERGNSLF